LNSASSSVSILILITDNSEELFLKILKVSGQARRGEFVTPHGTIQTPAFMNVATQGAIKGALSAYDLKEIHCQVQLCNTYHLHLRPGDETIKALGGLHEFTGWEGPILTDSGGFQVFSLAALRKIKEEGVYFASHIDGARIFMGPEESIRIQSNLGSTIAMAFDECIENPAEYEYTKLSCERTLRWLYRCKEEMERLNSLSDTLNKKQMLFGINQGATFVDLREDNMQRIAQLDLDGYAIGGLAVGEPKEEMYKIVSAVTPLMPAEKPRYLMGVGTPGNILECVERGIDLFDCVLPSRNARHGHLFTWQGIINLSNAKYKLDDNAIDSGCTCPVCARYSRAYIHHLFKAKEMLAMRLSVLHNLFFYNRLMQLIRDNLEEGTFETFKQQYTDLLDIRI
jgi:queuine tRNA-ribosyltransferase